MIAAIGAFDGFHAGHRYLLDETGKLARGNNTDWATVTFSPHPDVYFNGRAKLLLSEYEKCGEAKLLKIPKIINLPFGQICNMSPKDFLEMLHGEYSINGIVVGKDFRFGRDVSGDASTIRNFCHDNGLLCSIVELIEYSEGPETGNKISARVLREWFSKGKTELLRFALKFPCPISGIVVHGKGRGTSLGFPTINILTPAEKMFPAEGVYVVSVLADLKWRAGALFIGKPPMFPDVGQTQAEVHIADFEGDLYGGRVTVFLEEFLRPPVVFSDVSELARDIKLCVEKAKEVFKKNHGLHNSLYNELLCAFGS
ncbi:MAG: hypothetical protein FWH52_05745 [Synergistaceae bacterium]|nr:hypothetical protein [Synergistaceae bacterium]